MVDPLPDATGPWAGTQGYLSAFMRHKDLQHGSGQDDSNRANRELNQYGNQFVSLFKNSIGRDPTPDEVGTFFEQVVAPVGSFPGGVYQGQQQLGDLTRSFIADNFSQAAQEQAQTDLTGQKTEATRLSDLLMREGGQSLSGIADQLRDYQVSLFDKLRPQLNLAAQAGGYADSGGQTLQEQGALSDLGRASQEFLIPQYANLSNRALDVKYGGESAPYLYNQANILGRADYLRGAGENALQRAFQSAMNEQNYARQRDLMGYQNSLIDKGPGFWEEIGQEFVRGGIGGLSQNLGGSLSGGGGGLQGYRMYSGGRGGGMSSLGGANDLGYLA